MVFGVIYILLNTITGKIYVGQTKQAFKRRIAEHKRDSKKRKVGVDAAIRKYGWKNFRCFVIKNCASKAEMDTWEKFFIILLNSKAPNGYNLTDGGEGVVGLKRTPEFCLNIALSSRSTSPFKNLLNEIDSRKLSYTAVAKLLGLSRTMFSNRMRGNTKFKADEIAKLVELFGKPADYLMYKEEFL